MHKKHATKHTHRGYTKKYIHETMPRRSYHRGILLRKRRPFELFWEEILFVLFLIFAMIMLTVNYFENLNYVQQNSTVDIEKEIDVGVKITQESKMSQEIRILPLAVVQESM